MITDGDYNEMLNDAVRHLVHSIAASGRETSTKNKFAKINVVIAIKELGRPARGLLFLLNFF